MDTESTAKEGLLRVGGLISIAYTYVHDAVWKHATFKFKRALQLRYFQLGQTAMCRYMYIDKSGTILTVYLSLVDHAYWREGTRCQHLGACLANLAYVHQVPDSRFELPSGQDLLGSAQYIPAYQ
jgi:hypothetical protein